MELVGNHVPRPPAYAKLLGMRPLHAEPGNVRFEFRPGEQLLNPVGVIQGGFVTAMLDETIGPAALSELGPGFAVPTLELKVSFLRPTYPGTLIADARVVHRGKFGRLHGGSAVRRARREARHRHRDGTNHAVQEAGVVP